MVKNQAIFPPEIVANPQKFLARASARDMKLFPLLTQKSPFLGVALWHILHFNEPSQDTRQTKQNTRDDNCI
jgi:hypothetical protein